MWVIELRHKGLNKYRLIRSTDKYLVAQKAALQCVIWKRMWFKKLEREQEASCYKLKKNGIFQPLINSLERGLKELDVIFKPEQEALKISIQISEAIRESGSSEKHILEVDDELYIEEELIEPSDKTPQDIKVSENILKHPLDQDEKLERQEEALELTHQASEAIKAIKNILRHSVEVDYAIDSDALWEAIKDNSIFDKPKPQPSQPTFVPEPPEETDQKYQPKLRFLDRIFSTRRRKKIESAKLLFKKDHEEWRKQKQEIDINNDKIEMQYQQELKQWESEERDFLEKQKMINQAIDIRKQQYFEKQPDAVVDYCEIVLMNSEYPDYFPQEFDLDYNPETRILIVDYSLPSLDNIPKLKEVKYIQSRDEFKEVFLIESNVNKLYDSLVYQITLRTTYELYASDVVNVLASVVFNGWVKSIDKATGHEVNACILSVQANRQEFLSINLANVEPKACFKKLKGVGSSRLHSLTPIAPILNISREDKRFVSSYEVVDSLNGYTNLAAMDWQDFEHLIRELFEKEFSQAGGEVKVTQASRDGGVDAIAYDPDPIRGGKIVIQAKRYTDTVGVAAVRDLYGTVVNEGATKGILVTTADYGPDAYEFAKGKPLTLLNGSNLLHLLEKHGHKATINLKAAKQKLSDRDKQ